MTLTTTDRREGSLEAPQRHPLDWKSPAFHDESALFEENTVLLAPGDTVLMMSDGFPERLNNDDEMLGYDKAEEAFGEAASTSPRAIIDRLVAAGERWANGQPARDDMTFVVMKRREL